MAQYHIAYSQFEDRLLLSIDGQQAVVALTRRLTRALLKTTAKIVAEQKQPAAPAAQPTRDAVLSFENSAAVSTAYAEGRARQEGRQAPDPGRIKLAQSVDIANKKNESMTFIFKDQEPLLQLPLDIQATHVFMSSIVDIAAGAGWDFPEIASWLAPKPPDEPAQPGTKTVH